MTKQEMLDKSDEYFAKAAEAEEQGNLWDCERHSAWGSYWLHMAIGPEAMRHYMEHYKEN